MSKKVLNDVIECSKDCLKRDTRKNIDRPIFVVGVPRSGTTLLAAMLGAHPLIYSGPETDFFHFLDKLDLARVTDPSRWPQAAAQCMFKWIQADWKPPVPAVFGHSEETLVELLGSRRPSAKAMFEALVWLEAQRKGALYVAEKTPRHILYLNQIWKVFPAARVIHVVRDPRDVATSMLRVGWEWGPRNFVEALLLWRAMDRKGRRMIVGDKRAMTIRYEDLVGDPESALRKICEFVDVPYHEAMLETDRSYISVNKLREKWKEKVKDKIDRSRVFAWKKELSQRDKAVADALLWSDLEEYGYECSSMAKECVTVHPIEQSVSLYEERALEWVFGKKIVALGEAARGNVKKTHLVLIGREEVDWLRGHRVTRRLKEVARLCITLGKCGMTRGQAVMVRDEGRARPGGKAAKVVEWVFRRVGGVYCTRKTSEGVAEWVRNIERYPIPECEHMVRTRRRRLPRKAVHQG